MAIATLIASTLVVPVITAPAAAAAPGPVQQRAAGVATTDVLPTVQVDGVVWAQAIVGNTVYVAGSFTTAIPAPSDPDQTPSARANLLAYDLTTGKLIPSFNIALNAQAVVLATSPDKKRLYVGGDFNRRIMAIDTATNKVITSFFPTMNARVAAIVATNTTVYVGGNLTSANGVARTRFAAFNAADGALTGWAPVANRSVKAMTITPDGSKIIAGGQFETINGVNVYGLAALSPVTGAVLPWAATGQVRAYGTGSAISSLRSDGSRIFGTAYTYDSLPDSGIHEFEGVFSADPNSGQLHWLEDCHGDTHDTYSTPNAVYAVGHPYNCPTVGGFPELPQGQNRRALAFTYQATGTLSATPNIGTYKNWAGTPSPSMINWFPDLAAGTYTGQKQGPWTVTGSGPYVVMGGEFPTVNGQPQRGLVRMATRPTAPGKDGPRAKGSNLTATASSPDGISVRLSFQASWDRDDLSLTYKVVRNNNTAAPIYNAATNSTFWNRPNVIVTDTGLAAGTYSYKVFATDGDGNTVQGDPVTITINGPGTGNPGVPGGPSDDYSAKVIAGQPWLYWRLADTSGTDLFDSSPSGSNPGTLYGGFTQNQTGAVTGSSNPAVKFDGSSGYGATKKASAGINSFSAELWFKTTSTTGGRLIGFGDQQTGLSGVFDRQLLMNNSGSLMFHVGGSIAQSPTAYNDGRWHHAVGSYSDSTGARLYVDGRLVMVAGATTPYSLNGYWRIGGDSTWNSASPFLNGTIDEVAVYPRVLFDHEVTDHFVGGGSGAGGGAPKPNPNPNPSDPGEDYVAAVKTGQPSLYWRLGETAGTAVADSSPSGSNPGTLFGGYTRNQAGALTGSTNPAVKFDGSSGFAATNNAGAGPNSFTTELWFKTTSTTGGRLIGFGDKKSGLSGTVDRQVAMTNAGTLLFHVGSSIAQSPGTYNDGRWHHVVASFSDFTKLRLYVDSSLVATAASTAPFTINGYWRVGGDETWFSTSPFLNGTIDEVAVYPRVIFDHEVIDHYSKAVN